MRESNEDSQVVEPLALSLHRLSYSGSQRSCVVYSASACHVSFKY